ncbi:MAG TPA: hypothetical protein VEK80_00230 [Kribbellaceae bacterium]|nr:hypothetical protein [Kribbellaceae bacterium]
MGGGLVNAIARTGAEPTADSAASGADSRERLGRKGLYAAPLRLLPTGPARPSQGTWLTLIGW